MPQLLLTLFTSPRMLPMVRRAVGCGSFWKTVAGTCCCQLSQHNVEVFFVVEALSCML